MCKFRDMRQTLCMYKLKIAFLIIPIKCYINKTLKVIVTKILVFKRTVGEMIFFFCNL